jgi:hypothetical protein
MKNHVVAALSRHVTVRNCYIHHAYDYGGGGHGYGVGLNGGASDCLVVNNIFHTLRHAMIVQTGANGNVYGYNYSFDAAGCGGNNRNYWHSTDISIHGHYPYAILFEGNICQRVGVADFWGPAGPRMTLFRNRLVDAEEAIDRARRRELGIARVAMNISVDDYSHGTNILGNSLLAGGRITVDRTSRDCLVEANLVNGRIVWNAVRPAKLPPSLYLSDRPDFWGKRRWPGIGADVDGGGRLTTLPAQDWFAVIKRAGRPMPFAEAVSKAD